MDCDYRRVILKRIAIALLDEDLLNLNCCSCAEDVVDECTDIIEEKLNDFQLFQGIIY